MSVLEISPRYLSALNIYQRAILHTRWGKEPIYLWRVYNLHYCVCDRVCQVLSSRNLSGYWDEIGEESDVAL